MPPPLQQPLTKSTSTKRTSLKQAKSTRAYHPNLCIVVNLEFQTQKFPLSSFYFYICTPCIILCFVCSCFLCVISFFVWFNDFAIVIRSSHSSWIWKKGHTLNFYFLCNMNLKVMISCLEISVVDITAKWKVNCSTKYFVFFDLRFLVIIQGKKSSVIYWNTLC